MTNLKQVIWLGLALTLVFGGVSFADDVRELSWDDLIPEAEESEQPDVSGLQAAEKLLEDEGWEDDSWEGLLTAPVYPQGVVDDLDGIQAKLPGFIVPLELADGGKIKEFLLVPYFGACIHYPPPPPNQVVYVILEKPIEVESTWEPIWATGELTTKFRGSDLGAAGYTMAGRKIEEYEY